MSLVVCADFGSTFTKVCAVDVDNGVLLATAEHPTTLGTDVLDGFFAARASLCAQMPTHGGAIEEAEVVACSSAGGGLRLAVVGYERAITAEAGYRAALSAGARVVHVAAGRLAEADVDSLAASTPDVALLAGGTDGGDTEVVEHNARALVRLTPRIPIVVACNLDAQESVATTFREAGFDVVVAANVLPRIGVFAPTSARSAIRDVFLRHVIGGKGLSKSADFAHMVKAPTPDAVLRGIEVLAQARGEGRDVLVIDVGGATTDVYSVTSPDPRTGPGAERDVVDDFGSARTVEGDLGMRWSAPSTVEAAVVERLIDSTAPYAQAAVARQADPAFIAIGRDFFDTKLAEWAATIAVRRHARAVDSADGWRRGRDLRRVDLVIGSGGVLRHATPEVAESVLAAVVNDAAGGWQRPETARLIVDRKYALFAVGLLADTYPTAAESLASAST
jgi:uncharacterized protein (TIGR01319 family)